MKVIYCLLVYMMVFFAFSCKGQGSTTSSVKEIDSGVRKNEGKLYSNNSVEHPTNLNSQIRTYSIENTIGLLVANVGNKVSQPLSILNKDGSLWNQVAFEGNQKSKLASLIPFAKDEDTYLLAFRCLRKADGYYQVIVDENKKVIKYVKVNDEFFIFQTWQNYITGCFSVDFDPNNNPIKSGLSVDTKVISYDSDEFYLPVKIQGDWLQIKWGTENNWSYGWIQWKKNGALIIELFNNA